jgi:succinate dehydrogenase/fumarate reductase flavoprotein subunit
MLPDEVDVIVVGSGAAGLSAALAAACTGADVLVLEGSALWGGTSAISGGQVWVPGHDRARESSSADSIADAVEYCAGHSAGRPLEPIETFVNAVSQVVRSIEAHSPLRFQVAARIPDSLSEAEGGRVGRMLEPEPVEVGDLGDVDDLLWPPAFPMVFTNDEVARLDLVGGGVQPQELFEQRTAAGLVCMGEALVVGLLHGCRSAGVRMERGCRVTRLRRADRRVVGVEIDDHDGTRTVTARRGVVLANGGFESDPELVHRLQGDPATLPVSPPINRGDALRLSGQVGAQIAGIAEGWFLPVLQVPGVSWPDGRPRPQLAYAERGRPHLIWVNQHGQRFVDEASHNCAWALAELDPRTARLRNHPVWAIGDAQYRARSSVGPVEPGEASPVWLVEADSLTELARHCQIDGHALTSTVERFNQMVAHGADDDYGRGADAYDRGIGDPTSHHPNLGTIDRPPFFAVRIHRGTVGSRGGPLTDSRARVTDWNNTPIPGLYAAGNATSCIIGPGTIAPGLTLALALTWGWTAGDEAGSSSRTGPHRAGVARD